jgi:hypothetical protein
MSEYNAARFRDGGERRSWPALLISLFLHSLTILPLSFIASGGSNATENSQHVVKLFVATPQTTDTHLPSSFRPAISPDIQIPLPHRAEADPYNAEVPIDMNSIQLSVAEDLTNALPEVVRLNGGMFALAPKADPEFTEYVIDPPDWLLRKSVFDISGKVAFSMYPPEKWDFLRSVALTNTIQLDDYQASALFDATYTRCIRDTIRAWMRGKMPTPNGRIVTVRLSFSAGSECGIKILGVEFAHKPIQEKP